MYEEPAGTSVEETGMLAPMPEVLVFDDEPEVVNAGRGVIAFWSKGGTV